MKHRNSFLSILKASEAPMDAHFATKLREKFAQPSAEAPVSVLSFFIQSMKQHSFAYGAFLSLIALSVYIIIPKGLSPEAILAKAAENYEGSEGIYHEQVLHERFENGESIEKAMEEVWYDTKGNFLQVTENPNTGEILVANMSTINETGDVTDYTNDPSLLPDISEEQTEWYDTFEGGKIYCFKTLEEKGFKGSAILTLAEENYNIYSVAGESYAVEEDTESLYDIGKNQETAESELKALVESKDYSYKEVEENGKRYFTFSQALAPFDEQEGEGGRVITFFFNEDTFQMEKQVMTFKYDTARTEVSSYLVSEYLPQVNAENIFNPENYQNMVSSPSLLVGPSVINFNDPINNSGCYNSDGQEFSDEETQRVLDQIPEQAFKQWDDIFEKIKVDLEQALEP